MHVHTAPSTRPGDTLGSKTCFLLPSNSDQLAGSHSIISSFCCFKRQGLVSGWPQTYSQLRVTLNFRSFCLQPKCWDYRHVTPHPAHLITLNTDKKSRDNEATEGLKSCRTLNPEGQVTQQWLPRDGGALPCHLEQNQHQTGAGDLLQEPGEGVACSQGSQQGQWFILGTKWQEHWKNWTGCCQSQHIHINNAYT